MQVSTISFKLIILFLYIRHNKINCFQFSKHISKPAITDHLEIDQYMWAILNTLNSSNSEDVIIDNEANWKAVRPINNSGIKVCIIIIIWFDKRKIKTYLFVVIFSPKMTVI